MLLGQGGEHPSVAAAMFRLAARVRAANIAPIAAAGFVREGRPTFTEAFDRCVEQGASEFVLLPYFLTPNYFVREYVPRIVAEARAKYPHVPLLLAPTFGAHPAILQLLLKRALEADYMAEHPEVLRPHGRHAAVVEDRPWQPMYTVHRTGLLIVIDSATASPGPCPVYAFGEQIRAGSTYAAVLVSVVGAGELEPAAAIEHLIDRQIDHIIVAPYFLQRGAYLEHDLPAIVEAARLRHSEATIVIAEYLAYDRLLLAAIADRVAEALRC